MSEPLATCHLMYCTQAHDGPGWYYVDSEYPDEGSCGAFTTWTEAADHAVSGDYVRPTPSNEDLTASQCSKESDDG